MMIWKILLVVAVALVVASVENTINSVSYEELRNLLDAERPRADAERQRADAECKRADEAEIKLGQENSRRSRILAKCNDFSEIHAKALSLADSLPSDAFVPHIRSLEDFPDDANAKGGEYLAITAASTYEEREKAAAELRKYQPKFLISNIGTDLQIDERTHAYQDRGKTDDIVFSYDFVWGVERVKNHDEALFAVTIVRAHEKAHHLGHNNRYKGTDTTPENFRLKDVVCTF
jgi:hypothetical protein